MAAPKRSNNLLVLIGLVLLVVGTGLVVVLLRSNDSGKTSPTTAGTNTVPAVVAKRAISRGTLGKDLADAVEVKQVPEITRPSDALTTLGELADRTATVDIGAGQVLRAAFFRERTARGSVISIPEGKQAVAITVPFTPAVAGYVGQGDLVNVYALVTTKGDQLVPGCNGPCQNPGGQNPQSGARLVLSNVLVLDVSQEVAPSSTGDTTATTQSAARGASAAPTITYLLALDANQAERAVFLTTYADLYLSLVPKDQPAATTAGHDQSNVLKP